MPKSAARLGIGGPVGSGKTALIEGIVPLLMAQGIEVAVVTNDLLTTEDADRLKRKGFLPAERVIGVETGSCPHTAIREDPTMNQLAVQDLELRFPQLDLILIESGGDNLASTFSYELVDAYMFVIDVGAGDDIPRKNGPGFVQSDLAVVNKIDIAPYVGADLDLMRSQSQQYRQGKPVVYTNCKTGEGLSNVVAFIQETLLFGQQSNEPVAESATADVKAQAPNHQLALKLGCNQAGKTVLQHRYMAYPLSVSPVFRLEEGTKAASQRAYLYRMNTSPGLLAGDVIGISLQLTAGSQLYLADQSATKVHTMPQPETAAAVNYSIDIGEQATLEFLPEPLILFTDAALVQKTEITVHSTAGLSLGEIVLPGRLARGELYQFRHYRSRMQVRSPEGQVWFAEAMNLLGKNRFTDSPLFASGPVLGSLVLILPEAIATSTTLATLATEIEFLTENSHPTVNLASSPLPGGRGLFIRAISTTTRELQSCFKAALNCVRKLQNQALLPYSL